MKSRVDGLASFNLGKDRAEGGGERFYSAAEVAHLIPYLSRQNVLGREIYLTPIDASRHYLVVDDMTPDAEADLIQAGYRPALIQESSTGNRQAIIITPRNRDAIGSDEQSIANKLVSHLNKNFGDPAFSGAIHPFRMAGFSNKKPDRANAFTRIIEAAGGVCQKAIQQLEQLREHWRKAKERKRQEKDARRAAQRGKRHGKEGLPTPKAAGAPRDAARTAYDRLRARLVGLVTQKGWNPDESRVDYRAAWDMLADGWAEADVADAIRNRSPNIEARHHDPDGYGQRTAARARQDMERQRTQDIKRDDGPGFR